MSDETETTEETEVPEPSWMAKDGAYVEGAELGFLPETWPAPPLPMTFAALAAAPQPAGAFADFATAPGAPSISDPGNSHVSSLVVRDTGQVAGQWQRISATASAPNNYPGSTDRYVYQRAAYATFAVRLTDVPYGEVHQVTRAQLEHTPPGLTVDVEQVGSNLLTLEQSSYEARMLYVPTSVDSNYLQPEPDSTVLRVQDNVYCGEYSARYTYETPPPNNTYELVSRFASYTDLQTRRTTYAAIRFRPYGPSDGPATAEASEAEPLAGPLGHGLLPTRDALVPVQPGSVLQAQVAVATERPDQGIYCQVYIYDANFTPILSGGQPWVVSPRINSLGGRAWQTAAGPITMPANAAWAGVAPRVTTGNEDDQTFWVDEHRLMFTTTRSIMPAGASPARPWQPARQLTVRLRANRVNYVSNPAFLNNTTGYTTVADPTLTAAITRTNDGITGYCATVHIDSSTGTVPVATLTDGPVIRTGIRATIAVPSLIDHLQPETTYTASAYVRPSTRSVPLTIWAHNGIDWVRGTTSPIYPVVAPVPWARISVTFTTAQTFSGTGDVIVGWAQDSFRYLYGPIQPGTDPAVWAPFDGTPTQVWSPTATYQRSETASYNGAAWIALVNHGPFDTIPDVECKVDQLLLEEGGDLLDYFDGNFPGADYMWEGAVGNSRSHYYRGRAANQYRLQRALDQHIPLGGAYQILYASAP